MNKRRWRLEVISGKGRGKRLGVPTLNLAVPDGFDLAPGIYACWVWPVGDRGKRSAVLMGALHYGPIPTFGEKEYSLEVHLLDRELVSPPEQVDLEAAAYLRPVAAFPDVESLLKQIDEDVAAVRRLLSNAVESGRLENS